MEDNNKIEDLLNTENDKKEIKKKWTIRILIIILTVIVIVAVTITLVFALKDNGNEPTYEPTDKPTDKTTDKPTDEPEKDPQQVPEDYIELEDNEGEIEKEFAKMGQFNVTNENIIINENQKYIYTIFYPKIDNTNDSNEVKYPVIIFINNFGKTYKINEPIFNHLASYGFIIIVNDDQNSLDGESTKEILQNIENLNNNKNYTFHDKLDINNIGISCQDKSIISLLKLTNDNALTEKIKSVFCASPLPQKDILLEKQYYFYKNMTFKNIFFISSNDDIKFNSNIKYFTDIIMVIPRNTYENAIVARKNLTTRDNLLWKADSYHTAWYLYTLKNDSLAYKIFNGDNQEILNNPIWNNIKIRSEIQKSKGPDAIYVTDNFRNYVKLDENLEKNYTNIGNKEISTYEYLCDPNIAECSKYTFFNYIIYYPSELLENNDEKYPLIVVSNALNYGYFYITPLLENLASWGFVVIANDEGMSFRAVGVEQSLKLILKFNNDKESIFYNKIDLDNIGLSGHSAGSAGILYYTILEHNDELKNIKIKSLFPSCLNSVPMIINGFKIDLNLTKVNIPYIFLTSSEEELNLPSDDEFKREVLTKINNNIYQFFGRRKNTEHHSSYWNTIGYQTAWFLYTLTNKTEVKQIFEPKPEGDTCPIGIDTNEICSNSYWFHIIYCNQTSI